MDRIVVISSDCHAGLPWKEWKPYIEARFHKEFDGWVDIMTRSLPANAASKAHAFSTAGGSAVDARGKSIRKAFEEEPAYREGGARSVSDPVVRERELDREGVAGEVIYVDAAYQDQPAFGARGYLEPMPADYRYELRLAGARAYNRWLAEFCAAHPGRHAGIALIAFDDIPAAVEEIRWARKANLFGGILLQTPALTTTNPEWQWHHPRYEPIWAVCEELEMPVNAHTSGSGGNYGEFPGSRWLYSMEAYWTNRRPVWYLLWSGALERHPRLQVVLTELNGGWLPFELEFCEYLYDARNPEVIRQTLPRRPREYWRRQCHVGASPPSGRFEVENRQAIGVRNLMWGSDFPHMDGTWPHSRERMMEMFASIPEPEVRLMLGENAARVYGFDLEKLRPIAARIGPHASEFVKAAPRHDQAHQLAFVARKGETHG